MKKKTIIILLIIYPFFFHFINAQNDELKFNLVTGPLGKHLGHVRNITQDKYGYMWFSAEEGKCVYRYDGYRFIVFRHDASNANSLGGTSIRSVYADDDGLIWIGMGEGLDQYNPATGIFKHYRNAANDTSSLSSAPSWCPVLKDKQGRLWIGTLNGLDQLDVKTGKFKHYRNEPGNPKSLSSSIIWTIYEDHQGVIWIGTGYPFKSDEDGGLNRLNPDGSFTRYMNDPKDPTSIINNKVGAIYEDSRHVFWIGTGGDGLHTMDRATGKFERHHFDPKNPSALSRPPVKPIDNNDKINFIIEDCTGAIWIGTEYSGMNRYDPIAKKITHFEQNNGFPDSSAWNAYNSRDGVLWITTEQDNVYRVDPFHHSIRSTPTIAPATAFLEDKEGHLWISTLGNGLLKYDQQKNLILQYKNDPSDSFSLSNDRVVSLFQNSEDSIWVGTIAGLRILDKRTNRFSKLHDNKIIRDSVGDGVTTTLQDKQGNMWFSRYGDGLIQYNPKDGSSKQFLPVTGDTNSLGSHIIFHFLQDRSGVLWIGGMFGGAISRLNPGQNKFKRYLTGSSIVRMYEDSQDRLWAGTDKGLYKYDPKADQFISFLDPWSGLNSYSIDDMLEYDRNNFWIKTESELIKLDPVSKETFIYGNKYGIHPGSLHWLPFYKTKTRELLVGHDKGFYAFYPEELAVKSNFKIIIAELLINTHSILPGNGSPIKKPIEEINDLVLKYNQNNIAFNFAAIDYRSPETIKYFFMLENYDNTWREVRGEKSSYYFNLPVGNYVYRIKAFNNDGTRAEKQITIQIRPPWWQTRWAYAIYILSLIFSIWAFITWRTSKLKKEKIILEEKVAMRTKELKEEKEIVESTLSKLKSTQTQLIHAEKMASLGELTAGIAHEIQNPLNFVNNFSEINDELAEEAGHEIDNGNYSEGKSLLHLIKENGKKIYHHGKRADAIVKSMLQHSQTSTGQKELTDINKLADEYFHLSYQDHKLKNNAFKITLNTEFDTTIGSIPVIPQDMVRVLLNLYNNAFYAVHQKSLKMESLLQDTSVPAITFEPIVTLTTKKEGDNILISVKDNGEGIPDKIIDKIFQPFFTTKPTGLGTGLGLSISYDIIKAHGGTITVNSPPGGSINVISNYRQDREPGVLPINVSTKENEARLSRHFSGDTVGQGTEFLILLPIT